MARWEQRGAKTDGFLDYRGSAGMANGDGSTGMVVFTGGIRREWQNGWTCYLPNFSMAFLAFFSLLISSNLCGSRMSQQYCTRMTNSSPRCDRDTKITFVSSSQDS